MHSEDAVAIAFSFGLQVLGACRPATPSPSEALEGPARRRDAAAARAHEDDAEDLREDRAAVDAGISSRAPSCTSDRDCLTHRCDVAVHRCRFPCREDSDCNAGAKCLSDAGRLAACF